MAENSTPLPDKPHSSRRRRIIRVALWGAGLLALLPVVAWLVAAVYVHTHREQVLSVVLQKLNENIDGELIVESMEPELFEDFPNASIVLRGVALRDSLWPAHRRDLLTAKKVYVRISPFSAIGGQLLIRQAELEGGKMHLFTDSNGYSNAYLLKSKDTTKKKRRDVPDIHNIVLRNVSVLIVNAPKSKRFSLTVERLKARLDDDGKKEKIDLNGRIRVGGLAFNTSRGAFLKNKILDLPIEVTFDKEKRVVDIPQQRIRVDGQPMRLAANFLFSGSLPSFRIRLQAEKMKFSAARSMLSENISAKLSSIELAKPAALEADIRGKMKYRDTPIVYVQFKTRNNILTVPGARLTDCSFDGYFYNVFKAGGGYGDPNSIVAIRSLSASFQGIPITVDSAAVRNLKKPLLFARIRSKFPAERLNRVTGGRPLRFASGTASVNVQYEGSLSLTDTVVPAINGVVSIRGAEMTYTPRGLPLKGVDAQVQFDGTDIRFPRVAFRTGGSEVTMRGVAENALLALHRPQHAASLRWDVQSPRINLSDFLPFLSKRGTAGNRGQGSGPSSPLADRIDAMLDQADAHLTTNIAVLEYQQFRADAVRADVVLTRTHAQVRNASLRHAGGTVKVTAEVEQGEGGGPFAMKAVVRDVDVNSLFKTFKNFGQDALRSENIRGIVSFDANLAGRLATGAKLRSESMNGRLDFTVRKGALVNFEPLEKVGRYIFRNRNLSDLRFEVLKARFNLANERIEIEPMEVRSSALSLNLVGVYGIKSGTDISFQVPLRNPKKDSVDLAREADFEAGDRGIVIHLRAQNPTGKDLDIDWDRGGKLYKRRVGGGSVEARKEGDEEKEDSVAGEEGRKQTRKERREERRRARKEGK